MTPHIFLLIDLLAVLLLFLAKAYGLSRPAASSGLSRPGLAWIPFAQAFCMGEAADRQSLLSGAAPTTLRKRLPLWQILYAVCTVALLSSASMLPSLQKLPEDHVTTPERDMERLAVLTPVLLSLLLLWLAVCAVYTVLTCRVLHRIFKLTASENATLFTVLSVLLPPALAIILPVLAGRVPVLPAATEGDGEDALHSP